MHHHCLRTPALILALWAASLLGLSPLGPSPLALSPLDAQAQPEPAEVGEPVPSFQIEALQDSGRAVTPSDFEGRYVLMNLWATWCAPCIEKIPDLREARQRYSTGRLAILNVSFDRSRSKATAFLEKRKMPGSHAYASGGLGGKFAGKFARVPGRSASMRGIPKLTLIGPEGEVKGVATAEGSGGLLEMLSKHLSGRQSRGQSE